MRSCKGHQCQSARHYGSQSNTEKTTQLDILCVAITHSKVDARCTSGGKKTNHDCYYGEKAHHPVCVIGHLKFARVAHIGEEDDQKHCQWYDGEKGGYLPKILNALESDKHGHQRPDDRHDYESGLHGGGVCSYSFQDKLCRHGGIHCEPAKLKQAHQQTRYKKPPRRAVGRGTHYVQWITCLHTEQTGNQVIEKVT